MVNTVISAQGLSQRPSEAGSHGEIDSTTRQQRGRRALLASLRPSGDEGAPFLLLARNMFLQLMSFEGNLFNTLHRLLKFSCWFPVSFVARLLGSNTWLFTLSQKTDAIRYKQKRYFEIIVQKHSEKG
jgi:hypothetical protein